MYHPQTLYQNMQALFSALAEAEERQPYLQDSVVRRGTRGLAEYHLGDYGPAWNRCVPDRAGGLPLHPPDSRVFAAAASLKIIPCDHLSTQGGEQHRKLSFLLPQSFQPSP